MGGKGSTTTGQLPPEVRGLFSGSSAQIGQAQRRSPLSDYLGSYPEGVAPLSPLERHSIGQAHSLFDVANGPNAMALRSYMSLPELAAAGPTTGQYSPSNLDLRYYMDFINGPQYGAIGPEADYPGYGDLPMLGPELRETPQRTGPGGGPGSGDDPIRDPGDRPGYELYEEEPQTTTPALPARRRATTTVRR